MSKYQDASYCKQTQNSKPMKIESWKFLFSNGGRRRAPRRLLSNWGIKRHENGKNIFDDIGHIVVDSKHMPKKMELRPEESHPDTYGIWFNLPIRSQTYSLAVNRYMEHTIREHIWHAPWHTEYLYLEMIAISDAVTA